MILVELKLPTNKYDTMLEFSFAWSSTTNSNTGSLGEILTRLQQDGGQHCGVKQLTILSFAHPRVEVANVILGRNVNDYLPRLLHSCKLSARPYRWFRFGTAGISPFVQLCIYFQVNQPVSFRVVVILQQIDIIASTKPRTQLTSIFEPVNPSKRGLFSSQNSRVTGSFHGNSSLPTKTAPFTSKTRVTWIPWEQLSPDQNSSPRWKIDNVSSPFTSWAGGPPFPFFD